MECEIYRVQFTDYLAGALSPHTLAELESHVTRCPGCQSELKAEQVLDSALSTRTTVVVAPDFTQRVLARTRYEVSASPALAPRLAVAFLYLLPVSLLLLVGNTGSEIFTLLAQLLQAIDITSLPLIPTPEALGLPAASFLGISFLLVLTWFLYVNPAHDLLD